MIADVVKIVEETVGEILHYNLNMTKMFAKMVPKILTAELKEIWQNVSFGHLDENGRATGFT